MNLVTLLQQFNNSMGTIDHLRWLEKPKKNTKRSIKLQGVESIDINTDANDEESVDDEVGDLDDESQLIQIAMMQSQI